ncbi:hypothetical protein COXBURSA331_A0861 [Coxiella burnetii RSA 331]|nr:hypothetical protein COXBURSA331_A0861 [Coxiella burnetii RSA 331]EDR36019.1 hypothetical protein COXBURSA334_1095 [Coxiella burnetii Q321]
MSDIRIRPINAAQLWAIEYPFAMVFLLYLNVVYRINASAAIHS